MHAEGEASGWESLFWLVFGRSSNPIVLLDDRRRFVEVNDAALTLFDRRREDTIGTSMVENIRPAERAEAERDWERFLHSGEYSGSRDLMRHDGSEVTIDFAARLETIGGRRLAIYVAMVREPRSQGRSSGRGAELPLTRREREVVTMISLGKETAEIAAELHISSETVRTHVRNAMAKLGARTRAQLVAMVLCTEHAVSLPQLVQ
jgi:PAS domain S-box-containing protein